VGIIQNIEKAPLQSKKFLAYLLSNLGSKALLFWMVSKGSGEFTIISMITAAAFIDIVYILGQAALDKYVRVASIQQKPSRKAAES
jgi:hypothetical protein